MTVNLVAKITFNGRTLPKNPLLGLRQTMRSCGQASRSYIEIRSRVAFTLARDWRLPVSNIFPRASAINRLLLA